MNITELPQYATMCRDYLIFLKTEMEQLKPNLTEDLATIRHFAHQAKGTAGTYQLSAISSKAGQLQEMSETSDKDRITMLFDELYILVSQELEHIAV